MNGVCKADDEIVVVMDAIVDIVVVVSLRHLCLLILKNEFRDEDDTDNDELLVVSKLNRSLICSVDGT
ncbi:unnamed protein product [Haemonchus placei]|uniref:Ovule protein n=1 Tax=Haemonchus placei TaxID=6290 RepID=A0A0N4WEM8_HAEPC|nr:unnamed protein product [Haemonchus placei]